MCMTIDTAVTKLNKRIVWKVFDKESGKIASLYKGVKYPKGELVERSRGPTTRANADGVAVSGAGLYFYRTRAIAKSEAARWYGAYIAKCRVSPKDFIAASCDVREVMYERAKRVGSYIRVKAL
jgi:hypothetical protein